MPKDNRKEFKKYANFANKIKSIKNPKDDGKPKYGQTNTIKVLDVEKTKEKSIELLKEISEKYDIIEIKSKFWYKIIKHYSEL